ncbi:MAG: peptide ABC transporter substrate-binding protein [Chloroflexi bacterium]|nr:peptide ABC transporter substrate-binding protein [Chloroflexota bacterium]
MTTLPRKLIFLLLPFLLACQLTAGLPDTTTIPDTPVAPDALLITETPTATARPDANTYNNPDYGVQVYYPLDWKTEDASSDGGLTWFVNPDYDVYAVLYTVPLDPGDTLESLAAELKEQTFSDLSNVDVLSDEAIQLDSGQQAWQTLATGHRSDDDLLLKISLTTAIHGGHAFVVLAFGEPEFYDQADTALSLVVRSMQFETPKIANTPRDQALILLGGESTNPRSYDPATTHSSGDKLAFSGLVSFDPQLNLVPELAESWEISADGTVYTFHLRQNARFHDGKPVTAQDVVYSWERAASPGIQSDTVLTYLGDILGVREMNAGQAEHIAGLKALDEHTLQVTIDAPKPYFLLKLTYPTAFVVDQANVESGPEWYRTPNGTGPYKLTEWKRFEVMVYERNEDFYLGPPAIPTIIVQLFSGVGLRLYESGEIDMTAVYSYAVPRVSDPEEPLHNDLHTGVNLCTGYVVFDVTQPPFDDVKVRQAFSMAFDRQRYIDVVLSGNALPAHGLYPPGLPGFNIDLQGLPYDPERARQLLAESKYGGPDGLPPIVYTDAGIGNDAGHSVAAMAQMWEQNLGVSITIENIEPDRYIDEIYAGHHGQLFKTGWCADYPDPENFADILFHTGSPQNNGNYSNPALDALLEQARVEQDVSKRIALYQQAEQIIVDDAPVLFTVHNLSYVLVKPYVKGYVWTPIDIPLERYLWLDWGE